MRRFLFVFAFTAIYTTEAGAQRRGTYTSAEPAIWVSGGVAGFTGQGVNDGTSASTWDFGNSTSGQYRASLEKTIQNQSSFGIVGTYVRVPFIYRSSTATSPRAPGGARCASCDAHLNMMTLAGTFHIGGGTGFHQVIDLSAGVAAYRDLKRDDDGSALAPANGNIDPIFSAGYGFGYGLSQTTQINLVQDYSIALHEKKGLSNGVSNTNTVRALRVSVRYGFGRHSPRRR